MHLFFSMSLERSAVGCLVCDVWHSEFLTQLWKTMKRKRKNTQQWGAQKIRRSCELKQSEDAEKRFRCGKVRIESMLGEAR